MQYHFYYCYYSNVKRSHSNMHGIQHLLTNAGCAHRRVQLKHAIYIRGTHTHETDLHGNRPIHDQPTQRKRAPQTHTTDERTNTKCECERGLRGSPLATRSYSSTARPCAALSFEFASRGALGRRTHKGELLARQSLRARAQCGAISECLHGECGHHARPRAERQCANGSIRQSLS